MTSNDAFDADVGPNHLQNFSLLTGAEITNSHTGIAGLLHSSPNRTFTLELFRSPTADPSGHGEGTVFLARFTVATDGSGNATWSQTLTGNLAGQWITATATDEATGDTSVFSPALRALPPLAWSYARRAGAHFEAGFETLAGLGYSVLYNDDLNTAKWLVLTKLTGSGGLMPLVLPTEGVPHRFFRLRHP